MQILGNLRALGLAKCGSNFRYLHIEYMNALVLFELLILFPPAKQFPRQIT